MSQKRNRGVVYRGPNNIVVENIPYPTFEMVGADGKKRRIEHGAILKVVASNICGSDMHMARGRTTAREGTVFGHEITGEVFEIGRDVEYLKRGDLVSVPFNVACGRCENCIERHTEVCMNVNPKHPGGAYGYVDMGEWQGGQAEYVLVPYADFNLLRFPDKNLALSKILDLAMCSDILPTAYHGAVTAGVTTGSTVYIAGAGPVGLCAAASCLQVLGASEVIVGDFELGRLERARALGCHVLDLNKLDLNNKSALENALEASLGLGRRQVDCAIDCSGFETNGHLGENKRGLSERVNALDTAFAITKYGGGLGVPALYLDADLGAEDELGKQGAYLFKNFGTAWVKGLSIMTGQAPVMRYNRKLMNAILAGRLSVAKALDIKIVGLDEAPKAYAQFAQGAPHKFIIDPHGMLSGAAREPIRQ